MTRGYIITGLLTGMLIALIGGVMEVPFTLVSFVLSIMYCFWAFPGEGKK